LAESHRDLALFNMAFGSKLRGCKLVRMNIVDVMASGQIKKLASVLQSKSQKPAWFEVSKGTRALVAKWMQDPLMVWSECLWPWRFHEGLHISTRRYARIVRPSVWTSLPTRPTPVAAMQPIRAGIGASRSIFTGETPVCGQNRPSALSSEGRLWLDLMWLNAMSPALAMF
jgi:hypothetical protein